MSLERVNPTHVGIVWGVRKRKIRKTKGGNPIKIARIYFNIVPIALGLTQMGFLTSLTNYGSQVLTFTLIASTGFIIGFSLILWSRLIVMCDKYVKKCPCAVID